MSRQNYRAATEAANYEVQILNTKTGDQKITETAADGTFSMEADSESSYIVNFLDGDFRYIGTLVTGNVSEGQVSTAFQTESAGNTTTLGTITADTQTGKIVSDQTLNADSDQVASVVNEVLAGGTTGDGTTDYSSVVGKTCTAGGADCPDYDHDGVPDIFDTDNNNNSLIDEVDGAGDYCIPGTLGLRVTNYPTTTGIYSPDQIDADLANTTNYQVTLELVPREGFSLSDISEVSVTGPSYLDEVYETTPQHEIVSGTFCNNGSWQTCNGKKLHQKSDRFGAMLSEKVGGVGDPKAGVILNNMHSGDTLFFAVKMANGTEYQCTKKVNMVFKYYPYGVEVDGASATDSSATYDFTDLADLSWTVPTSVMPAGLTYWVSVRGCQDSGCVYDEAHPDYDFEAGVDASSLSLSVAQLTDKAPSVTEKWAIYVKATDVTGDSCFAGGFKIRQP
ncbi:MAG: hypothetical protein V1495_06990 [Pseudomonadota bacterium]